MSRQYLIFVSVLTFACGQKVQPADTTGIVRASQQQLIHEHHEEDENEPWWDTPKIGKWIEEEHLNKLIYLHQHDSVSILNYLRAIAKTNSSLLNIEIEGCAKEQVIYLKDRGRGNIYISKSGAGVLNSDTLNFKLADVRSHSIYHLTFTNGFNKLILNEKTFLEDLYQSTLNNGLQGNYNLYNAKGQLLSSIHYNGEMVFDSKSIYAMSLIDYLNTSDFETLENPIIPDADFMNVAVYTGKLHANTHEPEIETYIYEIKRTRTGFELHNRRERFNTKLNQIDRGLHFRFERK